jgi:predicted GTPase
MTQHHNTLEDARNLITSIQENLNQIYAVAPTLNGNNVIHESLIRSAADFKQAAEKLAHPALRIATIGTTSAGKSTLVNGLIGRQIAPMDAGEMSAGILHLVHSDKRHLKIDAVKNLWDKVDAANVDDAVIYEHVREKVFKVYHDAKQKQTIPVPTIRVEGELLPAAWSDLLQLPAGVNVEIFDLPGLNNINDKDNFKVIQDYLEQCFSLVVMNYLHTDSASRAELFKEVKKIVDALGGKTDAMIFVLNAVDSRSENDDSLEDRIKEFANAIQKELKLKETPNIIPVSARALFYAQCTWGWNSPINGEPTTDKNFQISQLKKFSIDCAKFLKEHRKHSNEVKNWLRDIEDAIDDNDDISNELLSTENLKLWVEWTWQHSGGLNLWGELRQRVNERFSEIVIAPTLIQPLASLEIFLSKLDDYSKTQRIANKVDVEKRKQELEQKFEDLQSFLEQESRKFEEQIRLTIQKMTDDAIIKNVEKREEVIKELFGTTSDNKKLMTAEKELRNVVFDIREDLIDEIIEPVQNYYTDTEFGVSELEGLLSKVLPPEYTKQIVKAAELYQRSAMSGQAIKEGICKKVRKDNESDVSEIKKIEKIAHNLFKEMRAGLANRASYMLQTRDYAMQESMKVLLSKGTVEIEKCINTELPEAASTLLSIYRQKIAEVNLDSLPDNIFTLGETKIEDSIDEITKTIDQTVNEKRTYTTGSCFESQHTEYVDVVKKVDVVENVEMVTLQLPNVEKMVEMWGQGIDKAETVLWRTVGEWFSKSAKQQNDLFQDALKEAQAHLLNLFTQRLDQSEAEYQNKLSELDGLDSLCKQIVLDSVSLRNSANMKGEF